MKPKVIDVNTDKIINKSYHLCKVNLGALSDFVGGMLGDITLKRFNIDTRSYGLKYSHGASRVGDDKKADRLAAFIFETASENNFISIYSENVLFVNGRLKLSGKFYLLDGYRRLFFDLKYVKRNMDREVYLKVYDKETTDQDMMKLMFHFNLWKFKYGVNFWFDRGWRLFIYQRLGIHMSDKEEGRFVNHFKLLYEYLRGNYHDDYTHKFRVLTSPRFYDDMRLMDKLAKIKDLIGEEDTWRSKGDTFMEDFIERLGVKRSEGDVKEMKIEYFIHYLKLQINEINKIKRMMVGGFYFKRIRALMHAFFNIWDDDALLKKLMSRDSKQVKVSDVTAKDFIASLPVGVVKEFTINHRDFSAIHVKDRTYIYKKKKLFYDFGDADNTKARIYLFFGDSYASKLGDTYFIIDNSEGSWGRYRGFQRDDSKTVVVYRGDLKGCIQKVYELTGRPWKPNRNETEFFPKGRGSR